MKPLSLATRRLVSAIADVTGDFERAREMAARSEAEKMLSAYLTYDEVKARKRATSAGARRGDGGDDAFFSDGQSGKNADAAATLSLIHI